MNMKWLTRICAALAAVVAVLLALGYDVRYPAAALCAAVCVKYCFEAIKRPDEIAEGLILKTCDNWLKTQKLGTSDEIRFIESVCYEFLAGDDD